MTHLLHLASMDAGYIQFDLECMDQDCEYRTGQSTHPDGPLPNSCDFVDWFDNIGNELLLDDGDHPFPYDPEFPIPVRPYDWEDNDDGPRIVYDPEAKTYR